MENNIKLINADCMDIKATYPDKYFDLALIDCPYGIGEDEDYFKAAKRRFEEHINQLQIF